MTPAEEIAGLLAKAHAYCSSVPAGDPRGAMAGTIAEAASAVTDALQTMRRVPADAPRAGELVALFRTLLGKLAQLLTLAGQRDLALQLDRAAARQRASATAAAQAAADKRTRKAARLARNVMKAWHASALPAHNRAASIATRLGITASAVRKIVKAHL